MNKQQPIWIKLLNIVILQWFFIRLVRCHEKIIDSYNLHSFNLIYNGGIGSRGSGYVKTYQWYCFQFWVLPLSGWRNKLIYLNDEPKSIRITKKFIKKHKIWHY